MKKSPRCIAILTVAAFLLTSGISAVGLKSSANAAELVVLGVAGGPPFQATNHDNTGFMLVVNEEQYLIDCGGGTPNNILKAGYQYGPIHNVFFTHLHLDHIMGYAELIGRGTWTNPNPLTSLTAFGPRGIKTMNRGARQYYKAGAKHHVQEPLRPKARRLLVPKTGIVQVYQDSNVVVTATRINHDDLMAFAYRFDIVSGIDAGKSIVFSGDRGPGSVGSKPTPDQFMALAQDTTVLVHEAQDNESIHFIYDNLPPGQKEAVQKALEEGHTDVKLLPQLALDVNAATLVLHHYIPVMPASVFHEIAEASRGDYLGTIIAPEELNVIEF